MDLLVEGVEAIALLWGRSLRSTRRGRGLGPARRGRGDSPFEGGGPYEGVDLFEGVEAIGLSPHMKG